MDNVPEPIELSVTRAKKRIGSSRKKSIQERKKTPIIKRLDYNSLKPVDPGLTRMNISITSGKKFTEKDLQDLLNKEYPGSKTIVKPEKVVDRKRIGSDMNEMRIAISRMKIFVDRVTSEIY